MAFNAPYTVHNFIGTHASEAAALAFIQTQKWDNNGNGTGTPRDDVWFYDSTAKAFKFHIDGAWRRMVAEGITLTQTLDAGGNRIVNLGAPVADEDAATKGYVDAIVSGNVDWQESVISKGLNTPPGGRPSVTGI